jgi:hypothetical protein
MRYASLPQRRVLYWRVLAWVNERRRYFDRRPLLELPVGIPGDPTACPLGRALGCEVGPTEIKWPDGQTQPLPQFIQHFVELFDAGYFPWLVEEQVELAGAS